MVLIFLHPERGSSCGKLNSRAFEAPSLHVGTWSIPSVPLSAFATCVSPSLGPAGLPDPDLIPSMCPQCERTVIAAQFILRLGQVTLLTAVALRFVGEQLFKW